MAESKNQKIEYINTPFSYTMQQQGMTLLQQECMNRISAHLQDFFDASWTNPEIRDNKANPRTFLTKEQIKNLGPLRIDFSELGISAGTYERLESVRDAFLDLKLKGYVMDDEKGPSNEGWNIISRVSMPLTDHGTTVMKKDREIDENGKVHKVGEKKATKTNRYRGYMEVYLNTDLVLYAFNTAMGYVSHPENIARIGNVPNMPLMYYFIRHQMNNFKPDRRTGKLITEVKVEYQSVRDYLGATKRNIKGEIVSEKYLAYSQFKSKVLKVALDDIKRVFDEGKIDFHFTMTEIRPRGKQKGTPSYLVFTKVGKPATAIAKKVSDDKPDFTEQYQRELYDKTWKSILLHTEGGIKDYLAKFTVNGVGQDGTLTLQGTNSDIDLFEEYAKAHMPEYKAWFQLSGKHFKRKLTQLKYKVIN